MTRPRVKGGHPGPGAPEAVRASSGAPGSTSSTPEESSAAWRRLSQDLSAFSRSRIRERGRIGLAHLIINGALVVLFSANAWLRTASAPGSMLPLTLSGCRRGGPARLWLARRGNGVRPESGRRRRNPAVFIGGEAQPACRLERHRAPRHA